MQFDLNKSIALCRELGLVVTIKDGLELAIEIDTHATLILQNLPGEDDNLITFKGNGAWHCHDELCFITEGDVILYFDERQLIQGLHEGTLLLVESILNGVLVDRWILHRDELVEFKNLQPNEELRYRQTALKR